MGFSTFIVRNLLFVFNLISVLAGLGLLVFGVITKYNLDGIVPERFEGAISAAPILSITIGSIIFFIAFLGCCGAIKKSKCMLIMYAVIVLCILVIQIAAGVTAFMQVKDSNGEFQEKIGTTLKNTVNEYESNPYAKEYMDLIQQKYKCCGARDYKDYITVPPTCCKGIQDPCKLHFKYGCTKFVYQDMKDFSETMGAVALGLCCTELLAIIFSLCLVSSINNEKRRGRV